MMMDFPSYYSIITIIILLLFYTDHVSTSATITIAPSPEQVAGTLKQPKNGHLPCKINSPNLSPKLSYNNRSLALSSTDYGNIVHQIPSAVLYPKTIDDIVGLIKISNKCKQPFSIAARGNAHSIRGQAMASNGVVVNMASLKTSYKNGSGIRVSPSDKYVDVGGEQLWIDVLNATLEHGLTPLSWTDYLYLSVGGTLSNAGVSGQAFLHGPQISNVIEMDVITGKGDFVTCSKVKNSELFYAVLGGLGQFGIITRARIPLALAPTRVKWVKMLYDNFSSYTSDQEHLISIKGLDYLEGSLLMDYAPIDSWRSRSFFSPKNETRIYSLLKKKGILYFLDMVKYYDSKTAGTIDKEIQMLQKGLSNILDFSFTVDETYFDFLNRVRQDEIALRRRGLWNVPHPWLNLFVPKSRITDFNAGVFVDIVHKQKKNTGPMLFYPTSNTKWDDRTSKVTPDEDIFYSVSLLNAGRINSWQELDRINNEILQFCEREKIKSKQYLPHYERGKDWIEHFGSKWDNFKQRKAKFDPRMILSPGQKIFNSA